MVGSLIFPHACFLHFTFLSFPEADKKGGWREEERAPYWESDGGIPGPTTRLSYTGQVPSFWGLDLPILKSGTSLEHC